MTKSKSPEQRIEELEMMLQSQSALLANVRRTMSRWANDESFASLLQGGPQWIDGVNIQQNTVEADRINAENLQALAVDTGSLTVDGDITIGAGGRIVDSNGSYWDEDEIVLKATASLLDRIRWVRDTFTPENRFGGYITATRAYLVLYGSGPTYTAALQLQSDDTPASASASMNVGSGSQTGITAIASGAIIQTVGGASLSTLNADGLAVDADIYANANAVPESVIGAGGSIAYVYNSTTETTIASATLPAYFFASQDTGSAVWNRTLHYHATGYFFAGTTSGNLTFRLKFAGTTFLSPVYPIDAGSTASPRAFSLDIRVYPRSSSAIVCEFALMVGAELAASGVEVGGFTTSGISARGGINIDANSSLAITSSQAFALTAQLDTADASLGYEILGHSLVRL